LLRLLRRAKRTLGGGLLLWVAPRPGRGGGCGARLNVLSLGVLLPCFGGVVALGDLLGGALNRRTRLGRCKGDPFRRYLLRHGDTGLRLPYLLQGDSRGGERPLAYYRLSRLRGGFQRVLYRSLRAERRLLRRRYLLAGVVGGQSGIRRRLWCGLLIFGHPRGA
jgi:hypothetical protein